VNSIFVFDEYALLSVNFSNSTPIAEFEGNAVPKITDFVFVSAGSDILISSSESPILRTVSFFEQENIKRDVASEVISIFFII
jgi:hypothetical protein